MSPALKNRLVGTIIVVAIAVIFLPDLLDGKQESKRDLFVDLPDKPEMKVVKSPTPFDTSQVKEAVTRKVEVINEPALDDVVATSQNTEAAETVVDVKIPDEHDKVVASSATVAVENPSTENSLAKQTVVDEDANKSSTNAGWVVQLGSFRHQKNVKELLAKLKKDGYRAFSRPVKTSSGNLTKVFVGPDLDKQKLTNALPHLKQLTNLQGRVTPFTVQ